MHIPANIPPEEQKRWVELLKMPVGTLTFQYTLDGLFDPKLGRGIILEIPTGQILYRIERDADLNMHFYHSTPGTKTLVATVNITPLTGSK
ncbi:MAG: hypothetical protein IMY88_00480 [Chloroflexi bacterium]|nr:hypothetical protein [Chloroflexota bacterium]